MFISVRTNLVIHLTDQWYRSDNTTTFWKTTFILQVLPRLCSSIIQVLTQYYSGTLTDGYIWISDTKDDTLPFLERVVTPPAVFNKFIKFWELLFIFSRIKKSEGPGKKNVTLNYDEHKLQWKAKKVFGNTIPFPPPPPLCPICGPPLCPIWLATCWREQKYLLTSTKVLAC